MKVRESAHGKLRQINAIYNISMKKIILLFVVILAIGGIAFLIFRNTNPQFPPEPSGIEEISTLPLPGGESASTSTRIRSTEELRREFGTEATLMFSSPKGSVRTDNFYRTASFITEAGDADIRTTDTYRIQYAGYNKTFYITLSGEDLQASVREAGEGFTAALAVSKTDACKLKIVIHIPPAERTGSGDPASLPYCPSAN